MPRPMRTVLLTSALLMIALTASTPALAERLPDHPPTTLLAQDATEPDGPRKQPVDGPTRAAEPEEGGCADLVVGLSHLCDGVTGTIGGGMDAVVTGGTRAAMGSVVGFVVDGAGWLLSQLAGVVGSSTRPDVTSGWFRSNYQDMATIGLLGLLPFLLLSIMQAVIRQSVAQLVRSAFVYVPLAALGTGAAIVLVDMLVTLTDELSMWIGRSMGTDLDAFTTGVGSALGTMAPGASGGAVAGFAALLAGAAVAFATFVIWLELLLRQAAIYVAVLFLPLGFMAMVWPATAHWVRRLGQGLVAIILSKFVIVAVMALATAALDADVADEGYGMVVAGASMLSLAALAPYVLLRLIPVFEAGLSSSLEGTFRRPTAAVGSPATGGRGQITRMLRQRAGGGAASAGAMGMPKAAVAGPAAATGAAGLALATSGVRGGAGAASKAATGTAEVGTPRDNGAPRSDRPVKPPTPSGARPATRDAANASPTPSSGRSPATETRATDTSRRS